MPGLVSIFGLPVQCKVEIAQPIFVMADLRTWMTFEDVVDVSFMNDSDSGDEVYFKHFETSVAGKCLHTVIQPVLDPSNKDNES
jgi:hypothetical protein